MAKIGKAGYEILEMIRKRQITPEMGVRLFTEGEVNKIPQLRSETFFNRYRYRQWNQKKQAQNTSQGQKNQLPKIAVIGMAGRYPGAACLSDFWNNLVSGKDSIQEIDRWDLNQFYDPDIRTSGKSPCKWGGMLSGIDRFDPLFFKISPKEAELMDPQQRLFLEESWKALEDAGYSGKSLEGKKCGVFIGFSASDYEELLKKSGITPDANMFTGNSESILSARISYFLNLKGPAITINTACSSSLAAIHLAYESIRSGTCDMAIAGGVQIMSTPDLYIKTGRAGMLSPVGKCKSFDNSADGFVPGEGVGIVVLKALDDAVDEGDHIYSIIIASGMNQDGHSNGITAPSAPSQTALELEVYRRNNIHPESITYIETHGTGTKLGDPIEIQALTDAFRTYTDKKQFCALGSIKTNIGHTLASAGVAGFIKAILCLHHGRMIPSLHFTQPNEHIQFDNSPFYVNTKVREWPAQKKNLRRAAISSFGFSGTNVHMVLEEYTCPSIHLDTHQLSTFLVVLSANSRKSLKEYVKKTIHFLKKNPNLNLLNYAYTLQMGREAMENRLAFTAENQVQVEEKLTAYLNQERQTLKTKFHEGSISQDRTTVELLSTGKESDEFIRIIIREGNIDKLGKLWVSGVEIPWELLYADLAIKPKRISLPTYPFANERYWVPLLEPNSTKNKMIGEKLHPLIDQIDLYSSFRREGLVFRKLFHSSEWVVRDHCVKNHKTLPGVAYLEMAINAGFMATGYQTVPTKTPKINDKPIVLSHVVWRQPFILHHEKQEIQLVISEINQYLAFTFQEITNNSTPPILYATGKIFLPYYSEDEENTANRENNESYAIDDIKRKSTDHMEKQELYNHILKMGVSYGPYFQGIEQVWTNSHEALSSFTVPSNVESQLSSGTYTLHPSIMDCALQTITGIFAASDSNRYPEIVPFSVEEVIYYRTLPPRGYVFAKATGEFRFQVTILEENGTPCLTFKDVTFRHLKEKNTDIPSKYFFYYPSWKQAPAKMNAGGTLSKLPHQKVLVVTCSITPISEIKDVLVKIYQSFGAEVWEIPIEKVLKDNDGSHFEEIIMKLDQVQIPVIYFFFFLQANDIDANDLKTLEQSQEQGVIALFRLLKKLIHMGYDRRPIHLKIISNDTHQLREDSTINPYGASLHGLIKSYAKENFQWEFACIDISLEKTKSDKKNIPGLTSLVTQFIEEPGETGGELVLLREGIRYVHTIEPIQLRKITQLPFKKRGVYFILGGASGIGFELASYLAKSVQARLILIGRQELHPHQEEKISSIKTHGGEALYIQADATKLEDMTTAVKKGKDLFGNIHGVIHSALVLHDMTIKNMNEEVFRSVLAPKVQGSAILYSVFEKENLDFMLFFSSAQSFTCLPGQSNYAAGCTFKDAYALYIAQRAPYPVKLINWGYWGSVGIVASDSFNKSLARRGIYSIEPTEGIEAIKQIIGNPVTQIIPLKGNREFLESIGVNLEKPREIYPVNIPSILVDMVSHLQLQTPNIQQVQHYIKAFEEMTQFIPILVLHVFQRMEIFLLAGQQWDKDQLKQYLSITSRYNRLFDAMLGILERADLIELNDNQITVLKFPPDKISVSSGEKEAPTSIKEKLKSQYPIISAHVNLLWACLDDLPLVLKGEKPYTTVMFPKGNRSLVEGIYTGTPISDYFHSLVALIIKEYLQNRLDKDPKIVINILEIGAGTGGTTRFILKELSDYSQYLSYWYTDISSSFTNYGQTEFGKNCPFINFQILDIEKPIETQGFTRGTMDLVIASNVLHATKRMNQTLAQVRRLLKANGLILINEATNNHDYATLTFGLTDGWWRFEDKEIRQADSPLLSSTQWRQLLGINGIRHLHLLEIPSFKEKEFNQTVLLGESDGIVYLPKDNIDQLIILPTQRNHMSYAIQNKTISNRKIQEVSNDTSKMTPSYSEKKLREEVLNYVKTVFSQVLKIEKTRLDAESTFERYGVDSLVGMDIINHFEKDFEKLPATLLFEHISLSKLSSYFFNHHREKLISMFSSKGLKTTPPIHAGDQVNLRQESKEKNEKKILVPMDSKNLIKSHKADNLEDKEENYQDIAIIGISGRYPQSPTLSLYWKNLKEGKKCIREIPSDRWNYKDYTESCYSKWGGFIEDVEKFDPLFFNISPREAEAMDPQERLFLEIAWEVFEDAGYNQKRFSKTGNQVGIFAGVMNCNYEWLSGYAQAKGFETEARCAYWSIANRISYFFNFQGPSFVVDSACSSSLTAIHLACESLRRRECNLALAGGVNLILSPVQYQRLCNLNMITAQDHCKTFGSEADGFVDGEGVGAVMLKLLNQAINDRDNIYAVIKGSAINAGGKTSGYTVPNPNAQADVITSALEKAQINPRTMGYVEAHGTGTSLGDPIEIAAITKAFNRFSNEKQFCPIGSVKSNIGHLESAAGIAAITKVLLQLKNKQLVPSLNCEILNPKINFSHSPFFVQRKLESWEPLIIEEKGKLVRYPRRAAISSFGAGGANAHVVIQEYEPTCNESGVKSRIEHSNLSLNSKKQKELIIISAQNEDRLKAYVLKFMKFLNEIPFDYELVDIAYTMQMGREVLPERLAIIASDKKELQEKLNNFSHSKSEKHEISIENIFRGKESIDSEKQEDYMADKNPIEYYGDLLKKRDLIQLAKFWVTSSHQVTQDIDWQLLYPEVKPNFVSLPTYPFARNPYWIAGAEKPVNIFTKDHNQENISNGYYPIIKRIDSYFGEHKFNIRIEGNQFDIMELSQGEVKTRMLSEMMYLGIVQASLESMSDIKYHTIQHTVWAEPLALLHNPLELDINFYPSELLVNNSSLKEKKSRMKFEVNKKNIEGDQQKKQIVLTQGETITNSIPQQTKVQENIQSENIKKRCPYELDSIECYRRLKESGFKYDTMMESIKTLYYGESELLIHLQIPPFLSGAIPVYIPHSLLLEGIIQSLNIFLRSGHQKLRYFPFELEQLEWYRENSSKSNCNYIVNAVKFEEKKIDNHENQTKTFNIRIETENGSLVVIMNRFSLRPW